MVERFELRPSILCLAGLVLVAVLTCCQGAVLDFQAESADNVNRSSVRMRSNAEGNLTVWLRDDEQLNMTFCLPAADTVTVTEVRFSCDGLAKEVAVLVDGFTVRDSSVRLVFNLSVFFPPVCQCTMYVSLSDLMFITQFLPVSPSPSAFLCPSV